MATGDVTGTGDDEVAIVHNHAGGSCPFPVVGAVPCGLVMIYDAKQLIQGEFEPVAEVLIAPQPEGCRPSNHAPSKIALGDVTGDGHAELAIGQLGLMEGTCGIVHVIPGQSLTGQLSLGDACVRIDGPRIPKGGHPDNFGVHMELFSGTHANKPYGLLGCWRSEPPRQAPKSTSSPAG